MRRIAPLLPIAMALATLTVGALRALAQEAMERGVGLIPWLPMVIVLLGLIPFLTPVLLLEWVKRVRRRSAAPPSVERAAAALASPALLVAVLWPLGVGIALLCHSAPVARALLVDHRLACAGAWAASVAVTAIWIAGAACRWIWWARPVAVVGTPPYR